MAIQAKWYGEGFNAVFNKLIDWDSDAIKVALLGPGYSPDQDNDVAFSNINTYEIASGDGYTTGGVTLTGKSTTYNDGTNVLKLDADDAVWNPSSLIAAYAAIYHVASDRLLGFVDFGGMWASSNSAFTIRWHADGVLRVTVA